MSKHGIRLPARFTPRFLDEVDGRTYAARQLRDRLHEIEADLGGAESLSYARRSLIRRAVWLESWIETQEALALEGGNIDAGRVFMALNSLVGLWRAIGLDRIARDTPSLHEYIARRRGE